MAVELAPWNTLLEGEELAYLGVEAARDARLAPLPDDLHPRLREALEAQGVQALYEHQAAAWEAAGRGEHLIVTTGTASGKTLAFNVEITDVRDATPEEVSHGHAHGVSGHGHQH